MTVAGNEAGNSTKSFQGLRVLDFSTTIAGPHCTRMLADTGAEVIKIETAEGETMRTRPPVRNNCSTAFGQLNIGKKSLVLDLKSPAGIEVIRRLIASTDVLVEIFGETGRHTRSAVGMAELPFDIAVEIELIAEVS